MSTLPLDGLRSAGVRVGLGQDGIRDYWSPYGNGDMLERAWQLAFRAGYRYDDLVDDIDDVRLRHLRSLEQEVVAKHRGANLEPSGRHRVSTDFATLDSSARDLLHRLTAKLM